MKNQYSPSHSMPGRTMGRALLAAVFALSAVAALKATPVTPAQALARLAAETTATRADASSLRLYHVETLSGGDALYLFADTDGYGFRLLPADDTSAPLLGYSDSGTLPSDPSMLPPSFRYWMGSLARQVATNAAQGGKWKAPESSGDPIPPMTVTRWNQDVPYSLLCPVAGDRHCYTGCVATALAQILKYHAFPAKGSGSHEYHWKNPVTDKDTTLAFDYAATSFDWDLMADRYDRDTPEDAKREVATLMYACGVAVDMDYGLSGSGASTIHVAPAMINYFGYDKGIRNYIRDYYGIEEWNALVYDQLKTYGPVQYSGYGDTDGHSFVCDGYDGNGYFHINWGWGGMSDGYFLLTALDPLEQGIGGAQSAFDFTQDFIGNVSHTALSDRIYEQILLSEAFTISPLSVREGERVKVEGGAWSYSAGEIDSVTLGIDFRNNATGKSIFVGGPRFEHLGIYHGTDAYDVEIPADLADGTYTVTPAFRDSQGEVQPIPVKVGMRASYTAVAADGTLTFTEGNSAYVTARFTDAPDMLELKKDFSIKALVTNSTGMEFYGNLCLAFLDPESGKELHRTYGVAVDVLPGEDYDFTYEAKLYEGSLKPGKYDMVVCHDKGPDYPAISEKKSVTVDDASSVAVSVVKDDVVKSEYYTLLGVSAGPAPTHKGVYILRQTHSDGKVTARRCVVR